MGGVFPEGLRFHVLKEYALDIVNNDRLDLNFTFLLLSAFWLSFDKWKHLVLCSLRLVLECILKVG